MFNQFVALVLLYDLVAQLHRISLLKKSLQILQSLLFSVNLSILTNLDCILFPMIFFLHGHFLFMVFFPYLYFIRPKGCMNMCAAYIWRDLYIQRWAHSLLRLISWIVLQGNTGTIMSPTISLNLFVLLELMVYILEEMVLSLYKDWYTLNKNSGLVLLRDLLNK